MNAEISSSPPPALSPIAFAMEEWENSLEAA